MQKLYDNGLLIVTENNLQKKYYEEQARQSRKKVTTWWDTDFLTSSATSYLQKLMGCKAFDNPKSINLLIRMLKMMTHFDKDALILDFFSGSATTAHAVMQLNAEDGGNRRYICVQLPEETPEDSEARKAGYATIPEIAKERIRRSGAKIKADSLPLLEQNNILYVDWNSLTGDSEKVNPTEEYLMDNLQKTTEGKNSLVILMHDAQAKRVTVEFLPKLIEFFQQQGYQFENFYSIIK